jgi:DNA-binding NtrC family response regulator
MPKKDYPLIFIVEDNVAYNKILEHHLAINQYTNVLPFLSGEECLKNLYRKPDIIVQDYKLQGISGLNVLRRTKKILPKTEFIFLSGIDEIDVAIDSVKFGAYYYIIKNDIAFSRVLSKIEEIKAFHLLAQHTKNKKKYTLLFVVIIILIAAIIWHFH